MKLLEPEPPTVEGTPAHAAMLDRLTFMREAGGHLVHIAKVRGEISEVYNIVARHGSSRPSALHVRCFKHVIFYLLCTPEVGPIFGGKKDCVISDLEWTCVPGELFPDSMRPLQFYSVCDGNHSNIDRSTSGVALMFGGAAILMLAFRQHSISRGPHDSEAFTLSSATACTIPIRGFLTEVGVPQIEPSPIFSDSASAGRVAENFGSLKQSFYIARHVKFLQESESCWMETTTRRIKGTSNPSNMLTKVVGKAEFLLSRAFFFGEPAPDRGKPSR